MCQQNQAYLNCKHLGLYNVCALSKDKPLVVCLGKCPSFSMGTLQEKIGRWMYYFELIDIDGHLSLKFIRRKALCRKLGEENGK